MFFDYAQRDGQLKFRNLVDILGREEEVEDVREVFRRNPRTCVTRVHPDDRPAVSASLLRRRIVQQTAFCAIACSALMQMFISDCRSKALASPAETHLEFGQLFLFNEK